MFLAQKNLFKAYDIRGQAVLFCDEFVHALSFALIRHYHQQKVGCIAIGYDVRPKSRNIALCLLLACQHYQIKTLWLGICTTPMMAFFAHQYAQGNGIIATASHSPKDILGIKWLTQGISAKSADIQALYQKLTPTPLQPLPVEPPKIEHQPYIKAMLCAIEKLLKTITKPKTLVIDCLDGATAVIAPKLFNACQALAGIRFIFLNTKTDGQFTKGNPDPSEQGRLAELSQAVLDNKADLGFAFDGDGDRLAVVDNKGRVLSFDWLIYLLAKASLNQTNNHLISYNTNPTPTILCDIKCSHTLHKQLIKDGIRPIWLKTGSSHLRQALKNTYPYASFAGELSGHMIFNDGLFLVHDDGLYAALRLTAYLQDTPLSDWVDRLPVSITTADIYLKLPDDYECTPLDLVAIIKEHLINSPYHAALSTIDGIRLSFDDGFCLLRASNTTEALTLRIGADSQKKFDALCQWMAKLIAQAEPSLIDFCQTTLKEKLCPA